MFEKFKKLFQRKKPETPKTYNHPPIGSRIPGPPPTALDTTTRDDSGDFATSFIVGMATNNAFVGGLAGGSFTGGLAGDLARDGALGEASKSHSSCGHSSSESSWSDSGSCDSSSGGD